MKRLHTARTRTASAHTPAVKRALALALLLIAMLTTSMALPAAADPAAAAGPEGPWRPPTGGLDLRTAFDPPPEPWLAGHRGVDLAGSGEVVAAGPGRVVFAGDLAGRGVISIAHAGGLRTTYEPVDPLVAAGDTVAAGQAIGTVQAGHASCSGAICLHLGLKRGPLYLDPMLLFGAGRVRLLPRPGHEEAHS